MMKSSSRQQLSSLVVASLAIEDVDLSGPDVGPSVHRQSRVLLRRPATGVSGHESLSSSEDEESRLSPSRGCFGRGGVSSDSEAEPSELSEARESDDTVEASEETVETEASMSEWASVYLTVVISSSSGVRNETRFSAGNMGRDAAILRGIIDLAGLLASTDTRLCGCL